MENRLFTKVSLLLCSAVIIMTGTTVWSFLPTIMVTFKHVPHIDLLSKLVLTLPGLFIALFSFMAGYLSDIFGRKKVLIYSLVLFAFAGTTGVYLNNIYAILAGRALLGVAAGSVLTTLNALIGDYFRGDERNSFMGLHGAVMAFGGVFFMLVGGFLSDINWHYAFFIYGTSMFVAWAVNKNISDIRKGSKNTTDDNKAAFVKGDTTKIYLVLILGTLGMLFYFMIPVQMPYLLKSFGVMSNLKIAAAGAVLTTISGVMSLMYGRIRRYVSYPMIFVLIFSLMAISYFAVSYSTSYGGVILSTAVCGLGSGLLLPNANVWMLEIAPVKVRGFYAGLLTSFLFTGQFLSPIVIQPIINAYSLQTAFVFAASVMAMLAIAMFLSAVAKYRGRTVLVLG